MTQDLILSVGLKEGKHKMSIEISGVDFDSTSGTKIKKLIEKALLLVAEKKASEGVLQSK